MCFNKKRMVAKIVFLFNDKLYSGKQHKGKTLKFSSTDISIICHDFYKQNQRRWRGGAEAKFLFLFKEKVSFGGSKHFQI